MATKKNNLFSVRDKIVIVTGGSGFLGSRLAETLKKSGAVPVIFDIAKPKNKRGTYYSVDITDGEAVKTAVREVIRRFGRIDVLVNNAAVNPAPGSDANRKHWGPYERYDDQVWRDELEVGLTGTFIVTKAVAAEMQKARKGSIINISSIYGNGAPKNDIYEKGKYKSIGYATVKGAILNFTRSWASYLGRNGIRVNTLSLGGVSRNQPKDFMRKYTEHTMLGRMAAPEDFTSAIVFLASDASSYMTGANLVVDGGWSAW